MNRKTKTGFTLIELLVVVLIIGILAAIALPQYQKAVEKARVAEVITILKEMDKAQQLCALEHGYDECNGSRVFENSDYVPPTPVLFGYGEGKCVDTAPCFYVRDWEFNSDDLLYACHVKDGEVLKFLSISTAYPFGSEPLVCAENQSGACSSIGM